MTKRIAYTTILLLFIMSVFTGCAGSADSAKTETVKLKDLHTPDADELQKMIDGLDNLSITDDTKVIIPNTDHVYECTVTAPEDEGKDMAQLDSDFRKMFEYLFPDHELNEDHLLYIGHNSQLKYDDNDNLIKDYNHVRDYKDDIISGKEGPVAYIYDEAWRMDKTALNNEVYLKMGSQYGYGFLIMNKGVTEKASGLKVYSSELKHEIYPSLEDYDPEGYLEYVATYPTDSTESYPLLNGEISICKAVEFFEDYINSIPYPANTNANIRVVEVDVYKITQNAYGYWFLTTIEYEGVCFDQMRYVQYSNPSIDYAKHLNYAFMAETNDVDVFHGDYRNLNIESKKSYETIIPLKNALKIFNKWMSGEVVFDIKRIELVNVQKTKKDENGYIDIVKPEEYISPTWKITLYNPNNDYNYFCYIDARDGENFRHLSASANYYTPEEERVPAIYQSMKEIAES